MDCHIMDVSSIHEKMEITLGASVYFEKSNNSLTNGDYSNYQAMTLSTFCSHTPIPINHQPFLSYHFLIPLTLLVMSYIPLHVSVSIEVSAQQSWYDAAIREFYHDMKASVQYQGRETRTQRENRRADFTRNYIWADTITSDLQWISL